METRTDTRSTTLPSHWNRTGLPAWCYHDEAFLELERDQLFRTHWQLACHVSDIPETGDYLCLDVGTERALIVRARDGNVHVMHNICRHRGSRVVPEMQGRCRAALVCPFHGWTYELDGSLRQPSRPGTFPVMDKSEFGLQPIEHEIWNGLVFLRFAPGPQPAVKDLLGPFADEASGYHIEQMLPAGGVWTHESPVNWKSVRDVDNEGYHVAIAHPALQDLYGPSYHDGPFVDGVSRTVAECPETGGRHWSVKHYLAFTEPQPSIPLHLSRTWLYYGLFPNAVIALTPESMQFYQEFPLSTGKTLLRGAVYRFPGETRRQRLARYLAGRIDRDTLAEDVQLTIWSNEAMASSAFEGFYLSDLEYGVKTHHDHLRKVLPVCTLDEPPEAADMASVNRQMRRPSARID